MGRTRLARSPAPNAPRIVRVGQSARPRWCFLNDRLDGRDASWWGHEGQQFCTDNIRHQAAWRAIPTAL